ncbi:hypothetical protein [Bifidobacterium aquikefiri]|uniref:hypothetical protein n=1 Tax=Bifidobacterium aquikefiri TaxID=1653207 RepID=UPI0039E99290
MNSVPCSRCGRMVDTAPAEGSTFRTRITNYSIVKWGWLRWIWLPRDARDRIDETHTVFTLCEVCADEVLDFVQGKAVSE